MADGPVYDGEWLLMDRSPEMGRTRWIKAHDTIPNAFVVRTDWSQEVIAEENRRDYDASEGKRWGDGQVFARVPLHIKYGPLFEPQQQGDTKWLKRFWNDPDNRWMRTFRGEV